MNRQTPWNEIREPSADYNVRLVAGVGTIPVYWGKDIDGHCLLLVELAGDHSTQFRRDAVQIQGIRLDLRQSDEGPQRFILTLEKHVDQDLFSGLCETLIGSLAPITDSATALSVALAHIKRWKAFLAGKKRRLLSPEEIRGLFAELLFIRSLYQGSDSRFVPAKREIYAASPIPSLTEPMRWSGMTLLSDGIQDLPAI